MPLCIAYSKTFASKIYNAYDAWLSNLRGKYWHFSNPSGFFFTFQCFAYICCIVDQAWRNRTCVCWMKATVSHSSFVMPNYRKPVASQLKCQTDEYWRKFGCIYFWNNFGFQCTGFVGHLINTSLTFWLTKT